MSRTVTKEQVEDIIDGTKFEVFHRVFDKQCIVVALLPNGFTVVGESACVDPTNYKEDIGFSLAVENIEKKLWELEGYVLQDKLYQESKSKQGMKFSTALIYMKRGHSVRCPEWGGYWYWSKERETIIIRTREGIELDIRDTEDLEYTLSFMNREDWEFVK